MSLFFGPESLQLENYPMGKHLVVEKVYAHIDIWRSVFIANKNWEQSKCATVA